MKTLPRESIRWRSVEEELPDADTTVLVYAPKSTEPVWLGFYDGCYWFAVGGEDYGEDDQAQVTHWANLPEGPR